MNLASALRATKLRPMAFVAPAIVGALLSISLPTESVAQDAVSVNGREIPADRIDAFVKAMVAQGRTDDDTLRQAVREELIARELFVQEAEKRTLQDMNDVSAQLIRARQDILIGALIRDELGKSPVSEDDIKKAYAEFTANQEQAKEYRARHILVEDESQAKDIIAKLEAGEDFAELAKASQDPGSASKGGDLDWNTPDTFVPEFGKAMSALDKGAFTKEPVKTQFGFHVIRLDDVRAAAPPPLESLRAQIKQQLERERVVALQQSLRKAATIK